MEQTQFMNRYAYTALGITVLFYLAMWFDVPAGAVIVAPLVFIAQIGLIIAAFRSSAKMSTWGKVVSWLLVLASIPVLFLSLIVAAAPFISFT